MSRRVLQVCVGIVALFVSLFSLKTSEVPFLWIGLVWIPVFAFYVVTSTRHAFKVTWLSLTAVVLALTVFEAALWARDKMGDASRVQHTVVLERNNQRDDILGVRPIRNTVAPSVKRYVGDKLIYDVTYTIGPNGLRKNMPDRNVKNPEGCILFFGGSFTFGEGVNDDETMPSQVGQLLDFAYRIYNFGFHGYGPHQMLAALDHHIVSDIASCDGLPIAIYQALFEHIPRSAGLSEWDSHGPRYTLGPDGTAVFSGNFDDGKLPPFILRESGKYHTADRILAFKSSLKDWDLSLFVSIVTTAKVRFEQQFPGGKFHVLLWDDEDHPHNTTVLEALVRNGIYVHPVSRIFPHKGPESVVYKIPHDGHPNALAHRLIAHYVVDHILVNN